LSSRTSGFAIDQEKREVTLKGRLGNVVTFVVDERAGG
jgi:hypothetical protein